MTDQTLLGIAALVVAVLGGAYTYFGGVVRLERRLSTMETKMSLLWGVVEQAIPKLLHSPHTPVRDALLDKLAAQTITVAEIRELIADMRCELREQPKGPNAAALVLGIGLLETKLLDFAGRNHAVH